ncbi:SHOCT domain-containing protein (plasmid) [Halomicrobium sp. IBSBa]|uniref:SHOCT domain-containing protein n=1 Tax=Halomicrobium sp. IBSBa TaxID=2778916 RepID=UPI001AC0061B|nr:SHOCT domain-containing protein [Halomicrobium sp. IBSBa]MBO4249020.1 SHOCT domain-containing protein [Halomicrobium sp. IBSBa]
MSHNTDNTRQVAILLLVVGAVVVFPMIVAGLRTVGFGSMMGGGMMGSGTWSGGMMGDGTMSGWMYGIAIVVQFLLLAALAGGGYLVYRAAAGSESGSDRALEELRAAYARGDLTDEEYEQRRETLEHDAESG